MEKKKPKKMRARHRGCAPTSDMPPPGPPPARPKSPGPHVAKGPLAANCQLYLGQFDLLFGPQKLLFCCLRRKWESLCTFQRAVGRDVSTLRYPQDACMGPRVGKGTPQGR